METDEEEEQQVICAICDNLMLEEQAKGWFTNIANEDKDVKNHVLQQNYRDGRVFFRMLKPDSLGESHQL